MYSLVWHIISRHTHTHTHTHTHKVYWGFATRWSINVDVISPSVKSLLNSITSSHFQLLGNLIFVPKMYSLIFHETLGLYVSSLLCRGWSIEQWGQVLRHLVPFPSQALSLHYWPCGGCLIQILQKPGLPWLSLLLSDIRDHYWYGISS
jgi:hypothetical protein